MLRSLVGSEMCIRDRSSAEAGRLIMGLPHARDVNQDWDPWAHANCISVGTKQDSEQELCPSPQPERPNDAFEHSSAQLAVLSVDSNHDEVTMIAPGGLRSFQFDRVFSPQASQVDLYSDLSLIHI
eukprot:TRINITY_DN43357_c0_g1_i1.p1 TRINITY_DN43357_c0_g1~~TRINITY_DN43357_c0_g1_i1.p1  ORF type:complete len:126 (+),score=33.78 TRINITY_DN43357_c0_g1_i1:122-499(+)